MMRIGIDARLYGVASGTGIGRYVQELLRQFLEIPNLEFAVFLRQDGYEAFHPPNENWTKVLADFRPYTIGVQTHYPRIIHNARVDFMHFTHFDHPIRCSVPFAVTVHDLILLHYPSIRATTLGPLRYAAKYVAYRAVLHHACRASRKILTPSETVRQQLHRELRVPLERITATPLGVDHVHRVESGGWRVEGSEPRPPSTINHQPSTPYLLYIGNAYPHKRLDALIAVVESIREQRNSPACSNLSLVIVGREDDFYRQLRAKNTKRPWIIWHGPASDEERTQLVCGAAAYITLSADEGFDLPTVEALALGTPVLASDIAIHREILGDAAILLTDATLAELPKMIEDLVVNTGPQGRRATLIEKGRARAQAYRWRTCAERTINAYRSCLDVEPPRRHDDRIADPGTSPPHSSSPISIRG